MLITKLIDKMKDNYQTADGKKRISIKISISIVMIALIWFIINSFINKNYSQCIAVIFILMVEFILYDKFNVKWFPVVMSILLIFVYISLTGVFFYSAYLIAAMILGILDLYDDIIKMENFNLKMIQWILAWMIVYMMLIIGKIVGLLLHEILF